MVRACGRYEGEVKTEWWGMGGGLREREHLEDLGIDGRIILKWVFKKEDGGVNWNVVSQDRDKWRPLVNAEMNIRVP
jgi:hypothetical protein